MIELQSDMSRQNTFIQSSATRIAHSWVAARSSAQIEVRDVCFDRRCRRSAGDSRHKSDGTRLRLPSSVQQASLITDASTTGGIAYEVQELTVELGQQVQAGQLLAKLSNHQSLYVVGHAFKREAPYLEQAAQERRREIEFAEDDCESLA